MGNTCPSSSRLHDMRVFFSHQGRPASHKRGKLHGCGLQVASALNLQALGKNSGYFGSPPPPHNLCQDHGTVPSSFYHFLKVARPGKGEKGRGPRLPGLLASSHRSLTMCSRFGWGCRDEAKRQLKGWRFPQWRVRPGFCMRQSKLLGCRYRQLSLLHHFFCEWSYLLRHQLRPPRS